MPKIVAYRFVILLRFEGVCAVITNKSFCLFVGLVLFFSHPVYGKELVIGKDNFGEVDLTGHIATLVDTHAVWDWNQLPKEEKLWDRSMKGDVLIGGLTEYVYWYKIELENIAADQYLVVSDAMIDKIDVFLIRDSGLIRHSRSGASLAFEQREVMVPDYYFLLSQGSYTCYLRLKKDLNFQFPLRIASLKYFMHKEQEKNNFLGVYFGILFVLVFYNLIIYISIKEKAYLYYIIYLCFLILATATLKGLSFEYLWPNTPYFNLFFPSYSAIVFVAIALFVMSLLETKIYFPKYTKVFYLFIGIYILSIIINLFSPLISMGIIQITCLIFSVYLILIGIQSYQKGAQVAKPFLWAWSFYLLCVIIYIGQRNGFILPSVFTHTIHIGSVSEAILFSLILAYRIKALRIEKEVAERREIQEREAKHLYLREQAHEIKNPVHLAANSVGILHRNLGYYNELLASYKQLGTEGVDVQKKREEIEKIEDVIKIELVKKELLDGVNSVEIAFNRIKDIANNFDLDSESCESTDVNKCIRDTLLIFRKESLDTIEIIEELGEIPEIFSYKGKLNQVIINLIKNAIEAIEEKPVLKNEFIFISTRFQSEKLIIRIKDTGVGMSEELKGKVFNKFYTTKAGGTGLGLGVCKKIIENHKGCIHIESEIGKGTEFILELPRN